MMGRKLRFCVAVLTLLMLLVVAPTETEAAKKKKKKAAKPTQQTAQAANPTGYYVRQGGEGPGEITIKWADKKKTLISVDAWGGYPVATGLVHSDSFEGTARLQGNRAEFHDTLGRRLVIEFQGNRLQVNGDGDYTISRIDGTYSRQKQKRKK